MQNTEGRDKKNMEENYDKKDKSTTMLIQLIAVGNTFSPSGKYKISKKDDLQTIVFSFVTDFCLFGCFFPLKQNWRMWGKEYKEQVCLKLVINGYGLHQL